MNDKMKFGNHLLIAILCALWSLLLAKIIELDISKMHCNDY